MDKDCKQCGSPIPDATAAHKYCNKQCRGKAKRARLHQCNPEYQKVWSKSNYALTKYYDTKRRAALAGIPFNLEPEDIVIPDVCPALGIDLAPGVGGIHPGSPSIDKIKPELGYVKGNVVVISNRANVIKQDATAEEIQAVADYVRSIT